MRSSRVGPKANLLKTVKSRDLIDMLLGVLRGEAAVSRVIARKLWEEFAEQAKKQEAPSLLPRPNLTRREMEVLRFLSEGFSDKAIASRLGISQRTVKNHVHNILEKLQLQNRVQAAAYALRQGLVKAT